MTPGLRGLLPALTGVCLLAGSLLLYCAFIIGPVTIAAPISGAYPAVVVLFAVLMGSRPSVLQWIGMAVTRDGGHSGRGDSGGPARPDY